MKYSYCIERSTPTESVKQYHLLCHLVVFDDCMEQSCLAGSTQKADVVGEKTHGEDIYQLSSHNGVLRTRQ